DSGVSDRSDRRLTATTWPLHSNFALLHASLMGLLGSLVGGLLRCEWSALARTSKATRASRRLGDEITFQVGNRDHRIVERGGDVRNAHRHILLLFLAKNFFLSSCFCHKSSVSGIAYQVAVRAGSSPAPGTCYPRPL